MSLYVILLVCYSVSVGTRKGVKTIIELILMSVVVIVGEVLIFTAFGRALESMRDGKDNSQPHTSSGEREFWQNIISYDHKKGGKKD